MLKLYGFAVSNYYNMVKHALLTKGIAFEDIQTLPGQSEEHLHRSPLGKVPCIETGQGFLSETSVILDYIEAAWPQPPLAPEDAWGRAKMRELMKISELYLELQGRRLMPAIMRGQTLDPATLEDTRATLEKGAKALRRLAHFQPWLLGEQMTLADIVLRYSLTLAEGGASSLFGLNFDEQIPGLSAWKARMAALPVSQELDAAMAAALPGFLEAMRGKKD